MTSETQHLDTGTRVLYRGGSRPAKGTIVDRAGGMDDVNELVLLDSDTEGDAIQVSRYWLTVLGKNDKAPGVDLYDLLDVVDKPELSFDNAKGVPVQVEWPGMGGGESRLVMSARLDRMEGEGSPVLILECGQQYDH